MIAALIVSLLVTAASLFVAWISISLLDVDAINQENANLRRELIDAERRARRRSRQVSATTDSRETN